MRVAMVGPTQSGKSSLFAAVAQAGGSHVDLHRGDQAHLAVVKVPDERLDWLVEHYHPPKSTLAELEFLDVPGFDLTDEPGRTRAKAHWPAMRTSDMLIFVVRGFDDPKVGAYRGRVDAQADLQELLAEMMFADLEQVTARIDKLQASLRKSGADTKANAKELELMQRLQQALEQEHAIAEAVASAEETKALRSFAFLSQKPALVVLNCSERDAAAEGPAKLGGLSCLQLSAKIEAELSQLPPEQRQEFMAGFGLKVSARDRLLHACMETMKFVTFLTTGDECRAWAIPAGTDALTAAGMIHSDMARGFIRAETVAFEDLRAAGDMKGARAAGKVRLEGKNYVVQDGDVIHFRFNV